MTGEMTDRKRVTVLDGGMSTTLEQLGHDVSGPMWGSEILIEKPEVIRDVHRRWAESGAELLGTCTYQMTLSGLYASNTPQRAAEIMDRSISLAHSACTSHKATSPSDRPSHPSGQSPGVVLSLGPFGAHLKPSQEYAGVYPPPYGPSAPPAGSASSSSSKITANHYAPSDAGREEEQRAEVELAVWHYERLRAFAESSSTAWDQLEWVAFETVPLLTEIRAVRRAIGLLHSKLGQGRRKRFWIASAFPNGLHPQTTLPAAEGGEWGHAGMDDFVTASIGPLAPLAPLDVEVDTNDELKGAHSEIARLPSDAIPPADAIGINCTSPAHLPALVRDMTAALDLTGHSADKRPALVLYPDGGAVYDTTTKTWTNRTSGAQDWATDVAAIASEAAGARTSRGNGEAYAWAGVIVGGCCKAGFEEIRLLKQELDRVV